MISFIAGVLVTGASAGGLWYALPRDGKVHWIATTPVLASMYPVAIVCALSVGIALIVSGIVS